MLEIRVGDAPCAGAELFDDYGSWLSFGVGDVELVAHGNGRGAVVAPRRRRDALERELFAVYRDVESLARLQFGALAGGDAAQAIFTKKNQPLLRRLIEAHC